jgi:hypothetical protein
LTITSTLPVLRKYFIITLLVVVATQSGQSAPEDTVLLVPGGKIDVTLPDEQLAVSRTDLLDWIKAAANAVTTYYGHFPIPHLTLRISSDNRSGVHHGVTYPKGGGLIVISVGRDTTVTDLKDDWMLTHEMIHPAFPNMADSHHWIEEGISTYVESMARAQAGQLPVSAVWKQFIIDMPKGQPGPGDQGLDNTHTWGRTYWGGALFCLVADVRIRERTHNKKGLQDALRGIVAGGGRITENWEIEKALTLGDKSTGTTVLMDLYKETRDKPSPANLDELWQKLGLELKDGKLSFNDAAPDAAIRKAITARK